MGTDWNIWVSGTPPGGSGPVPVEAHLAVTQPMTALIGGSGTPVVANVDASAKVDANANVDGNLTANVAGNVTANVAADIKAEMKTLPDLVVRVREIPKFELTAPTHFKVGFSLFGFELFAITLTGEGKLRST